MLERPQHLPHYGDGRDKYDKHDKHDKHEPGDEVRRSRSKTKSYDLHASRGRGNVTRSRPTSQDGFTGARGRDASTSRESQLRHSSNPGPGPHPKKKFSRNSSSDLLQTTLNQNHYRSTLTKSFSAQNLADKTKNIPMEPAPRPPFKRWNLFNMVDKKDESKKDDGADKNVTLMETIPSTNSISPLTVLKDEYNIKRPSHNGTISNPDNSFSNLVDADLTPTTSTGSSRNKLYNRIVSLAHNSMHSLVPMFNQDLPNNSSSMVSNISNYQSEDDESEEEEEEHREPEIDTQYRLDLWKSPSTIVEPSESEDFQSIVNEINQFQNTFVDKSQGKPPAKGLALNRTQQKVLDYKELYSGESSTSLSTLASGPNSSISSILNSYNVKIQSETITSQYTAIRLRFASRISLDRDKHAKSHTGVLGFLNRVEYLNKTHSSDEWYTKCMKYDDKSVSFENKDDILRSIWEALINAEFNSKEEEESPVDFSEMARNVKLNTYNNDTENI